MSAITSAITSNLFLGFINDFIIVAGGIISGAMMATGQVTMPSKPVLILALVLGVTQGARRAQSKIDPSQAKPAIMPGVDPDAVAEALLKSLNKPEVTPRRVPDVPPPPAPPVKVGGSA